MPLYEYKCKSCDHRFEVTQSISDDPLTECPKCGGEIFKLIGSVGVQFRGSGFYINDSKGKSSSGSSSSSSNNSPPSAG